MKIVLLGPASSIHVVQWANNLASAGHEVTVISQHKPSGLFDSCVTVYVLPFSGKLGYFANACKLRKLLLSINADVVNAHYATGYGTLARLVGFSPTVLSVWGSDVFSFTRRSMLHNYLVSLNINSAQCVTATSSYLATRVGALARSRAVEKIPFGVDVDSFFPRRRISDDKFVFGTVKSLEDVYGIDILLRSFALFLDSDFGPGVSNKENVILKIFGKGSKAAELEGLARELGISDRVVFEGEISHKLVPEILNGLDVFVALSREESFGVSILEAAGCGLPIIVSDCGGLLEIIEDRKTGLIVPRESPHIASEAMHRLYSDSDLRDGLGRAAREMVNEHYSWDACLRKMMTVYETVTQRS